MDDKIVMENPNNMIFRGNHLFHYTTLESAIKIILTNSLKFGSFYNMNDIAEVNRELYDKYGSDKLEKIIPKYQSISMVEDTSKMERGFAIDTLWGYYANKGNGVCLVFDKNKILREYYKLCRIRKFPIPQSMSVSYEEDFTNTIFVEEDTKNGLINYVKKNIQDIFYKKSQCWAHEKEFRLIIKSEQSISLKLADSLIGAIICVPSECNYKNSEQYKLLSELQANKEFSIYHYGIKFGNRILEKDGEQLWPITGLDYEIDV